MRRARLIKGLLRLLVWLPLPLIHALGNAAGMLLYLIPNRTRTVAQTNLALCLPELEAAQQKILLRRTLRESAKTFLEFAALWLWPCTKAVALARATHGEELLRDALAEGKGVILLTPHLGAWEMSGLYTSVHYPITSLYRPPRMTELESFVRRGRERCGARLVPTDHSGIRALFQALHRGEIAGILPDQDPGRRGLGGFAPFFGVPAYTMHLVSRLAVKTGAPVLIVHAERLPYGKGFHLHFRRAPDAIHCADSSTSLAALNQSVEACVREQPAQYQWGYKRFKTRPEGTAAIY